MSKLIKNIEHSQIKVLADLVDYDKGKVSSLTLTHKPGVAMTVFAFDEGEGVNTHAAPGDALVYVIDGEAAITIDKEEFVVKAGETIVMPSSIPHAVKAKTRFKMLLILVKE